MSHVLVGFAPRVKHRSEPTPVTLEVAYGSIHCCVPLYVDWQSFRNFHRFKLFLRAVASACEPQQPVLTPLHLLDVERRIIDNANPKIPYRQMLLRLDPQPKSPQRTANHQPKSGFSIGELEERVASRKLRSADPLGIGISQLWDLRDIMQDRPLVVVVVPSIDPAVAPLDEQERFVKNQLSPATEALRRLFASIHDVRVPAPHCASQPLDPMHIQWVPEEPIGDTDLKDPVRVLQWFLRIPLRLCRSVRDHCPLFIAGLAVPAAGCSSEATTTFVRGQHELAEDSAVQEKQEYHRMRLIADEVFDLCADPLAGSRA